MSEVRCLYCGKRVPEDASCCPHCNAPSHYQRRGLRFGADKRFILWFILLVLFSFAMVVWLPR